MKIAITAANGQLGSHVLSHLLKRVTADSIVTITRKPFIPVEGGTMGENRLASYDDKTGYLAALQGIDILLLISSNEVGKRATQHSNVIRAAQQAGVKRIVYTSLLHADVTTLNLGPEHKQTEELIMASGLPYTILRNGWYTENYTVSVPGAIVAGAFIGSAGEGRISSAPRSDYAEAAAIVLSQPGHEGKTYELAGDTSYQLSELAAEISKQTGKLITYLDLSEQEYAEKLLGFGLPEGLAHGLASWDFAASKGALYDDSHQLSLLLGRPTGSLADAIAQALQA